MEVWEQIPLRQVAQITTKDDFKTALVKLRGMICLPPTGITNSVVPCVCWSLWLARNTKIFEGRTLSPIEIATRALRLAREWNTAQTPTEKRPRNLQIRQPNANRPSSSTIASPIISCTTDAAWNKQSKQAGLAWTFSGTDLPSTITGSTTQPFVSSPLLAEALAVRLALIKAATFEFPRLKVSSDNQTLIRAISNDLQLKEIHGIIADIHQISSVFNSISFSYLPRLKNQQADGLTKLSLRSSLISHFNGPSRAKPKLFLY